MKNVGLLQTMVCWTKTPPSNRSSTYKR